MVKIRQYQVPQKDWAGGRKKSPYTMKPEGITVHNTANDASASNEAKYIVDNPSSKDTSYHFAVDNKEAVQILPLNRNGWHAGDGANGFGNRKTIGIEICYSKSGGQRFIDAEKNAAKLIAKLLKDYGWGISKVGKHQDRSGKYCPHRTLDMGWQRFLNMIKAELNPSKPVPNAVKLPSKKRFTTQLEPTSVWDLTTNPNYKAATTLTKGAVFEAYATIDFNNSLYYITEYSFNKGLKNGINSKDLKEIVETKPEPPKEPPVTPPEPPVEPEKPVEPEVPPEQPTSLIELIKQLIVNLINWLKGR